MCFLRLVKYADDVREEHGQSNGNWRQVLLVATDHRLAIRRDRFTVDRGLEYDEAEQRRPHDLGDDGFANRNVELETIGAQATGAVSQIIRRG